VTAPQRYADADTFQLDSTRTDWLDWRDTPERGVIHAALGLAAEAGELAGIVQKWQGQGHDLDTNAIIVELGDALWFAAKLARVLDVPLSVVMARNVAKLAERYPNGWDAERSRNRGPMLPGFEGET
jgi:NTP pyrophosphatase (non-canonical NTP hydrolase)